MTNFAFLLHLNIAILTPEYFFSGTLTVLTNVALLIFMTFRRKLRSSQHAITISSLVTAFLFAAIYIFPRFSYAIKRFNDTQVQPDDVRCGLFSRIGLALFLSLSCHILLRTIQMYLMICHPFKSANWLLKRNTYMALVLVWSMTIAIPLGTQIYFEISYTYIGPQTSDFCRNSSIEFLRYCSIITAIFSILVLFLLTITYGRILIITNRTRARIRTVSVTTSSTSDNRMPKLKRRSKAMNQVLTVYMLYFLFWIPFLIMVLYTQYNPDLQREIWPDSTYVALRTTQYIAFLFPAIQPILFAIFTSDIYTEIAKTCHFHRRSIASKKSTFNDC
ncbi:Melatonin receptor type 1B-B [Trichoplax sp. H2]|nr:Melatonin receptor type 1B-B [Trichoplax sp. H2]|eukprot:RDD45587.1 Melatonin receptor type 1B-B [Trichoplax sp. H2]